MIPKRIVPELLSTPHGKTNKHPEIPKLINECRTKYYYPGLARNIRTWIISCPDCIANWRIDTMQIRPKMLRNTEFTMGPGDCLEIDIQPHLPSSSGHKHIITSMDVFYRYFLLILRKTRLPEHHRRNNKTMSNSPTKDRNLDPKWSTRSHQRSPY